VFGGRSPSQRQQDFPHGVPRSFLVHLRFLKVLLMSNDSQVFFFFLTPCRILALPVFSRTRCFRCLQLCLTLCLSISPLVLSLFSPPPQVFASLDFGHSLPRKPFEADPTNLLSLERTSDYPSLVSNPFWTSSLLFSPLFSPDFRFPFTAQSLAWNSLLPVLRAFLTRQRCRSTSPHPSLPDLTVPFLFFSFHVCNWNDTDSRH